MKKVLISFSKYAEGTLLQILRAAINSMTGKAIFADLNPSLAAGLAKADEFDQKISQARNNGRSAVASKNAVKKEVVTMLRVWAVSINMTAKGNPQIIADSGLPTSRLPQPTFVCVVTNIKVEQGLNPGTLDVSFKKTKAEPAVICCYTSDPVITKNTLWLIRGTVGAKLTLINLEEGKKIWIKFTSIGSKDTEAIGEAVSAFVMPRSQEAV